MKIKINFDEEKVLHLVAHFCEVIKEELLKSYEDYDSAYKYLFKEYNIKLKEKNIRAYEESRHEKDETSEDKIFSLICDVNRNYPFLLYSTIIKIAKSTKEYYLNLFVLLDHKINFNSEDHNWGSYFVFDKKDNKFVYDLLVRAYEKGLLVDYMRVSEALYLQENPEKAKDKKDKSKEFLNNLKNDLDNLDYITFEESDEFLNNFNTYKNNFALNYKEIVLSKEFQNYLKEEEFDNYDFEDFQGLISCYLENSGNINFKREIVKKIIKDNIENVLLNEKTVKELKVDVPSLI